MSDCIQPLDKYNGQKKYSLIVEQDNKTWEYMEKFTSADTE